MPPAVFAAAWVIVSAGYAYSGYTKLASPSWIDGTALARVLTNPLARHTFVRDLALAAPGMALRLATWAALALELAFAPLALFPSARRWIWAAMVGMHLGLLVFADLAEIPLGLLIVDFFTFDPRWVPARWRERRDRFFYDGTCGLCHRATRFILSEDRSGTAFTFAPLQGATFAAIAIAQPAALPDSIVVSTEQGHLLTRSDASLYTLQRLGGVWRVVGVGMSLVPRALRDRAYDFVARIRYRLFTRPETICPILPADLRSRFHD